MSTTLQRPARLSRLPGICMAFALVAGAYADQDQEANNASVALQAADTGHQLSRMNPSLAGVIGQALGSRFANLRADGNGNPISSLPGQYASDFEAPLYVGSADGTIITGQDEFYIPVPDSFDGLVYTYAGNALGLPANPTSGGNLQFAGVTGGDPTLPVPFARAQRDVVYGDGTGAWTVSFDIAATFNGVLPSAQNIGSFSTQIFPGEATFIALATWTDPDTAANWNADYVWFDAAGTQLTESVADPGFQNLNTEHWYRWSTTFNLDTNQIVEVSITDLTTGATSTISPVGRYLEGGTAGGSPPPSGFRLFGGSGTVEGNSLGFDNISIDLASGTPSGACCFEDETCDFLTQADCGAAGGIYQGDWTGCPEEGCIAIPKACGPGSGPCNEPNGSPGCEDEVCCALVCVDDPICCILDWDQLCADAAIALGCATAPLDCPAGGDTELTQSLSDEIIPGNSVACSPDGGLTTTENSFARSYDLGAKLPGQALEVNCVAWGIEANSMGVDVDATVNIYEDTDGGPPLGPGVDLVLLGSQPLLIGANAGGTILVASFDPPVNVPAGAIMVVELDIPDMTDITGIWPGSNPDGQTGPSYIRSEACGLVDYDDLAAIGFPDMHLVNFVIGNVGGGGDPCPADIDGNGTVGSNDLVLLLFNWGLCDDCNDCSADIDGNCTVGSNDLVLLLFNWGPCP